jgi:hypothetical protein
MSRASLERRVFLLPQLHAPQISLLFYHERRVLGGRIIEERLMKLTRTFLAGLAVASLVAAPALAEPARSTAPAEDASELAGNSGWFAIAAVIAVVALAVIAATNGDDDNPVSA